MHTSTLLFWVSLTFGLTSGRPNPIPKGTATSTVPVVPRAAGSPYPSSPTTNEFQYLNFDENSDDDKGSRINIHNAFSDWAAVIQKAIDSLANTDDNTYQTWFPQTVTGNKKDVRDFLAGVYNTLFDSGASTSAPLPYVASFVNNNKDYGGGDGKGICDSVTTSYFSRLTGNFHVCPFGFDQPIKATDIQCSSLGTVVSSKMHSLTGTLIHEFMHSQNPGDATPNGKIQDVEYGASSCMRMAQGVNSQRAFANADSYHWFALNAFYNSYCDTTFGNPAITEEDFDAGQAELEASPEFNAALADGALEGV